MLDDGFASRESSSAGGLTVCPMNAIWNNWYGDA
jgi:hypothetical protein